MFFSPVSGHQWKETVPAPLLSWFRSNSSTCPSTSSFWLRRNKGRKMTPGVTQGQRGPRYLSEKEIFKFKLPVAKGAIPEERKVNPLKLGKAQVLPTPGLDILHPVNTNWPTQDMSKAEDMKLFKCLPWL